MEKNKIFANKKQVIQLLLRTKREGIENLIDWLEHTDYFIAPASTKYHLDEPGGLVAHCLGVLDALYRIDRVFNLQLPQDTKIIAALNHDNCKINLYKWIAKEKKYTHNDTFPYGHGEKSVYLTEKYIKLTELEAQMIRWHMTAYEPGWDKHGFTVQTYFPKAYALYFADHMSTVFLEKARVKEGCY